LSGSVLNTFSLTMLESWGAAPTQGLNPDLIFNWLGVDQIRFTAGVNTFGLGIDNVNVNVSAVPVPAAVWLFGSGLAGLIGASRKKKQALAA